MKSGIYKITNVINNKCYIGSAKNIVYRWRRHKQLLRKNAHHSVLLQRAWNKYKSDSFRFEIVENIADIEHLVPREQYYLDLLRPDYNVCKIAGKGGKLGIKNTKKEIERKRQAWSGKNNPNFGGLSKTHIKNMKISLSKRGGNKGKNNPRYGSHLSDETKQKIAEKLKGRTPWNKRK